MTQQKTTGYIFVMGALTALVLLSWYSSAGIGLFFIGIPSVFIAGFVGANAHKLIVSRNLFFAAFVGIMVSCAALFLAPLIFFAVLGLSFLSPSDVLGAGLFWGIGVLFPLGPPVFVFGAFSGLVAYWVANNNKPIQPPN